MKKVIEVILIIVGVIILAGMLFFAVDSNRVKQGKTPIFCIRNLAGVYKDGGTVEYFGLGYKVIDFNMLNGYDEIKIGTWFMDYNDFKNEFKKLDNIAKTDTKYASLEDLPKNYSLEQAINDGCFVITRNKIYNKHILENFINNTSINAKERKEDSIRIVQCTTEGDPIITEVSFKIKYDDQKYDCIVTTNYIVKVDSTRDKFSDRKITTNEDFPGSFYGITEIQKDDVIEVTLALYAEICYATPDAHIYENYIICSYNKNATVENDMYEIKSADNFELAFYDKHPQSNIKVHTIIDKNETDKYDYNIYAFGGNVNITIDGKYMSLRDALLNNKITMNEIIKKANKDIPNAPSYDDGGSMEYHYPTYTIIKLHKLDGNRDVYIGGHNLKLNDINV